MELLIVLVVVLCVLPEPARTLVLEYRPILVHAAPEADDLLGRDLAHALASKLHRVQRLAGLAVRSDAARVPGISRELGKRLFLQASRADLVGRIEREAARRTAMLQQ